ncbi:sensor histidine kinase [Lysinibacillus sphaericus]|uniref:sensor histidine kinase n=1 Tax=Lysinibacillus sphaericus TaxID=1421 RepID=UPI003D739F43
MRSINFKKITNMFIYFFVVSHIILVMLMLLPTSGVHVKEIREDTWVIDKIDNHHGKLVYESKLKVGDEVLEVNGKELSGFNWFIKEKVFHATTIKTSSDYIEVPAIQINTFILELLIPSIFSIIILTLGLIFYLRKSVTAYVLILYLLCAALSLFASTNAGNGSIIASAILSFSFILGGFFLNYFIIHILKDKKVLSKINVKLIMINFTLAILVMSFRFIDLFFRESSNFSSLLMLAYFSINTCQSIFILSKLNIQNERLEHSIFLKTSLFIQIIAFGPFIFLHVFPLVIGLPYVRDDIVSLFLFAQPVGYIYLFMTKELFDINFMISRLRYYIILSVVPSLSISGIVVLFFINSNINLINFIAVFLCSLLIYTIFLFIKDQVDFKFRHQFINSKHDFSDKLDQFVSKLSEVIKNEDLFKLAINEIGDVLTTKIISIIELKLTDSSFEIKNQRSPVPISNKQQQLMLKMENGDLMKCDGLIGCCVTKNEQSKVYIWVGDKADNTSLNMNEKIWLSTVTKYIGLVYDNINIISNLAKSIENNILIPSSPTLSCFLFQLSEKERHRLATDLHDGALQEQIILYRKLEHFILQEELNECTKLKLIEIQHDMKQVIDHIRLTCQELIPYFLNEVGLSLSLKNLCSQFEKRANFKIQYEIEYIRTEKKNYDMNLSLYRIIQELLNNAQKHSEASLLFIMLWSADNNIYIDYRDDGIGIMDTSVLINNPSIGIRSINERIKNHNGTINYISSEGKGLEINITIPR